MAQKVNLNQASREELMAIEGVGASTADGIIEFRESRGGISDFDELREIPGMNEVMIDKVRSEAEL